MKLQIGSGRVRGKYRKDDWINIDIEHQQDVNVLGDAIALPFKTGSIEEIHCVHVLEHVTRDKSSLMLGEMYRVLKPGGSAYVEVPDFKGTVEFLHQAFEEGDIGAIHIWTTSVYGKNEREGMAHHWGFYEGLLRREMRGQGFKNVDRLTAREDMISDHYRLEPVLLIRGTK
jgi:predicted SAM-dependent methyltransferase